MKIPKWTTATTPIIHIADDCCWVCCVMEILISHIEWFICACFAYLEAFFRLSPQLFTLSGISSPLPPSLTLCVCPIIGSMTHWRIFHYFWRFYAFICVIFRFHERSPLSLWILHFSWRFLAFIGVSLLLWDLILHFPCEFIAFITYNICLSSRVFALVIHLSVLLRVLCIWAYRIADGSIGGLVYKW